jgi:hypothetical protein
MAAKGRADTTKYSELSQLVFELLALSLTPFNKAIKSTPLGRVSDA